jgi:uncharacterized membrane protein YgcG
MCARRFHIGILAILLLVLTTPSLAKSLERTKHWNESSVASSAYESPQAQSCDDLQPGGSGGSSGGSSDSSDDSGSSGSRSGGSSGGGGYDDEDR